MIVCQRTATYACPVLRHFFVFFYVFRLLPVPTKVVELLLFKWPLLNNVTVLKGVEGVKNIEVRGKALVI